MQRGKPEYWEANQQEEVEEENQQQAQPAYDTEFGMPTRVTVWY